MPRSNIRKLFRQRVKDFAKTAPLAKAPKRTRVSYKMLGRSSSKVVIVDAAIDRLLVEIKYKRTTKPRKIKNYMIEPYSYRWRRAKATGRNRRALYGYDIKDKRIKGFYIKAIQGAKRTVKRFRAQWPVEIGK